MKKYPPEIEIARLQRDAQIFHDLVDLLKVPVVQVVGGFLAVEAAQRRGWLPNTAGNVAEGAIAAPAFAGALNTGLSGAAGGIASIISALK